MVTRQSWRFGWVLNSELQPSDLTRRWRFCNTIHCDVEGRHWGTQSSPSFTCPLVLVLSASEPPELSGRTETVVFCRTLQDRSASGHSPRVITAAHKESSWVCVFTADLYKQVYYNTTLLSSFEDKTPTHNVNSFFVLVSRLDLRVCVLFPAELGPRL